jgi:predicted PurR-regulated permease PerM
MVASALPAQVPGMPVPELPPHRDLARITLGVLGILLLIVGSLYVLRPFVGPALWASTIAIATWPLLTRIEGWLGHRRAPAVAVMTVTLLLVLFLPLGLALATLLRQTDRVTELLREFPGLTVPPLPDWIAALPILGPRALSRWQELAGKSQDELAAILAPYVRTGLVWLGEKAGGVAGTLVQLLITVVISAILFARGEAAVLGVRRFFQRLAGERGDALVVLAGKSVRAVALGIVVTAGAQTVVAGLGLVAARVPFAGLLTAVVLVLCIAQLGPLLALLPPVIWLYATGAPGRGTFLLVVMVFGQALDNVLRPVLIRRGADLSLLLIFPGVVGGLLWLGVIGLFVGPVTLAVTWSLLADWIATGLRDQARPAAVDAELHRT